MKNRPAGKILAGHNSKDVSRAFVRAINFESLTEKIETRSPAGRLVFHVFAALTEFELASSQLALAAAKEVARRSSLLKR
jgi:DNA invertase Pin-like site-specific DNA recombinase